MTDQHKYTIIPAQPGFSVLYLEEYLGDTASLEVLEQPVIAWRVRTSDVTYPEEKILIPVTPDYVVNELAENHRVVVKCPDGSFIADSKVGNTLLGALTRLFEMNDVPEEAGVVFSGIVVKI